MSNVNKLFVTINSVKYDLTTIFSGNVGSTGSANAISFPPSSGLDLIANTNTDIKPTGSTTKYTINNADFTTIFNPIYNDVTSGTNTVSIPAWASRIGFIIVGAGGNGGIKYTDSWSSVAGYSQGSSQGNANYNVGSPNFYFSGVFQNQSLQGFNPGTISGFNTNYNQVTNYTTSTATYPGAGGGGGGCVAGVYNITTGGASTFTYSLGTTGTNSYIQFNETSKSTTSVATAKSGTSETTNTSLAKDTTDTAGVFGTTSFSSNGITGATTTVNQGVSLSNQGYYTTIYQNSGNSGVVGTSGGTSAAGGVSGLSNNATIQTNFLPCLPISSYGNGGTGTNNTTTNTGQSPALRYWFLI